MKKYFLLLSVLTGLLGNASAQLSKGGIPKSFENKITYNNVPVHEYANPDWAAHLAQEKADFTKPYVLGLMTATDFGFPQSGQFITLDDGSKVWRGKVFIPQAPAIGFIYDEFYLPKGVKLFLSNANGMQVLGAYTSENNDETNRFMSEPVQGDVVNIELNIDKSVNIADIKLHIPNALVFHRGIENLRAFIGGAQTIASQLDSTLTGSSSVCTKNAICPQGDAYGINRKATVQTIFVWGNYMMGSCSATLMNNTGNKPGVSCSLPYVLLATHCEQMGYTNDAIFAYTLIRFNFEKAGCTSTEIPTSNTIQGAKFISRANYYQSMPVDSIKGDFLLLQLKQQIPASWNATLSGWNRTSIFSTTVAEPKKFIGFHHPSGDVKKLSYSHQIQSAALGAPGSHWEMALEGNTYVAGGSSGSGLFDGDGYLIGQASVASPDGVPAACQKNSRNQPVPAYNYVSYSKFSYSWDYALDGNANNRKLKPWLDPANTGVMKLNPINANCTAIDGIGITNINKDLSNAIAVYPNPSIDGKVNVKLNMEKANDISVEVFDVTGKSVFVSKINKAFNQTVALDLGAFSNGVYVIKFTTDYGFATKKVIIAK